MPGLFLLRRTLLVAATVVLFSGSGAWAQNAVCSRALEAADDQYVNAEYEEARRSVSACLNQSDIPTDQAVTAYRLLALIHLKRDELEEARSAIVNILGIDPTYSADPVESPPSYVSLVAIVRRDVQPTKPTVAASTEDETEESDRPSFFRRKSTWITLGGIVVGSGVATVLVLDSGGGGDGGGDPLPPTTLPLPPGTP